MIAIVLVIEALASFALLGAVLWRYRRPNTLIIPMDVFLWTWTGFFLLPLMLDGLGRTPIYQIFPGIDHATRDIGARLVTVLVLTWCTCVTLALVRTSQPRRRHQLPAGGPVRSRWWLALAFVPILLVLLAPEPSVYRVFAAPIALRGYGQPFADRSGEVAQFNVLVGWSTYISSIALSMWYRTTDARTARRVAVIGVVAALDFWLNGKRHILALIAIQLLYSHFAGKRVSRQQLRRIGAWGIVSLATLLVVSMMYQREFRPHYATTDASYELFRVDYDRLGVLRLSVERQLDGGLTSVLDYPGQSAVLHFNAVAATTANNRDVTYADRVDSVARDLPIADRGGSITTSIVSELVDNFSLFGIVLGFPLFVWTLTRLSTTGDPLQNQAVALAGAMLLVVHVLALVPLVILFLARGATNIWRPVAASSSRHALPLRWRHAVLSRPPR